MFNVLAGIQSPVNFIFPQVTVTDLGSDTLVPLKMFETRFHFENKFIFNVFFSSLRAKNRRDPSFLPLEDDDSIRRTTFFTGYRK